MSASPLELAVPTTVATPGARNGASTGASTGTDAQSGKDFAALVAQALGLAHPGAEQTPTTPAAGTGPQPGSGDATPKAGTPVPAQQGAETTTPDPATDAPLLTDQAARDAVVAALGLTLVAIPVPVPTTAPTSGPAATPDAGAKAVTAVATPARTATTATATPGPRLRPAPTTATTPVDATTDPTSTTGTDAQADLEADAPADLKADAQADLKTGPKADPTAASTPAVPTDAPTQPAGTATAVTAAAALAAATAANGAGAQDGPKDGRRDGEGGKQDADTAVTATATSGAGASTATSGAGASTATTHTPAAAVTTPGDTVQVVASGPVVVTPAAPSTQATQAAAGRTHAVHHVATQVIPEITRLVSDGDGVHRVTLQLNPRALGDVRVVLTMRQGDVHVRLVAGDDARAALASSSSELTRALDQLGLKDHRIILSSLADPSATTWSSGSDQTNDPRQHAQHPGGLDADLQDQKNAQHLWMGDDSTATDGMTPSNPAGRTSRSVPVPTFGATPAGALDVRM